ncbi:MAG: CPBP family intramembrane metalloprotease [Acidobacteria bacterium]|nr:CPBP family intramembrane metalloprotease [Acidobacteriota bacterium]
MNDPLHNPSDLTPGCAPPRERFSPSSAAVLLAAAALLMGFGGIVITRYGLKLWSVVPFQALALIGPSLLLFRGKAEWRRAIPFLPVTGRKAWPTVPLLAGASMAAIGVALAESLFIAEGPMQRGLREGVLRYSPPLRLALFAIAPALLEEAFFRGILLACLRSWGRFWACATSAVIFALFHLNPEQMVPVLILGGALAFATWETGSLWPAVLGHAFHNSIVLLALGSAQTPGAAETVSSAAAIIIIAAGLVLCISGGRWLASSAQEISP